MQITGECLAVKGGAEGVYCAIVPGQRIGIALKIDDGGSRAAEALMGLLLVRYAGLASDHSAKLEKLSLPAIFNAEGKVVGETRPARGSKATHEGSRFRLMASRVERLDTERVDFCLHGIAQCIVDQSMARQCRESVEIFGDYGHMEMTTSGGGAWMADV